MMIISTSKDDLDVLDFASMRPPHFVTRVGDTLVFTPSASFPGVAVAWTEGNAIQRRRLFLDIGNAHLAEVQLRRLHPATRQLVLDHLPEKLPVEDPVQYTRVLGAAIKDAVLQANDHASQPQDKRLSPDDLEAYRRCLLVRAVGYGGPIDGVSIVAISMPVDDYRTRTPA